MIKLYNTADVLQANQIVAYMKDNGIEAYSQGVGSGGYMSIVGGFSVAGFDIYVDEKKADEALELLKNIIE